MYELTAENAAEWLSQRGLDPATLRITELGGGVSSTVLRVECSGQPLVVKQALGKLKVQQEWLSDRSRVQREVRALQLLAPILPTGSVPTVRFVADDDYAFGMDAASDSALPWKRQLLDGIIRPAVGAQIGQMFATLVSAGCTREALREPFYDQAVFDELRLDAYYRSTAERHPDLAGFFDELISRALEPYSLVHGDFSPKNILVNEDKPMLIDWEVVHVGDPGFDAAFLTNHLILKMFFRPQQQIEFASVLLAFWTAFEEQAGPEFATKTRSSAMRHLPGLMLARMDGKSPIDYIVPTQRPCIRRFARSLVTRPAKDIPKLIERKRDWPSV